MGSDIRDTADYRELLAIVEADRENGYIRELGGGAVEYACLDSWYAGLDAEREDGLTLRVFHVDADHVEWALEELRRGKARYFSSDMGVFCDIVSSFDTEDPDEDLGAMLRAAKEVVGGWMPEGKWLAGKLG